MASRPVLTLRRRRPRYSLTCPPGSPPSKMRSTTFDNISLSRSRRFNLNEVFDAVASLFRPESGRDILKAIADTHAPSQTVHYTRATAVLRPSMKAFVPGVAGIKGHARGSLASSYP